MATPKQANPRLLVIDASALAAARECLAEAETGGDFTALCAAVRELIETLEMTNQPPWADEK